MLSVKRLARIFHIKSITASEKLVTSVWSQIVIWAAFTNTAQHHNPSSALC